jgi:hypothetical protein
MTGFFRLRSSHPSGWRESRTESYVNNGHMNIVDGGK